MALKEKAKELVDKYLRIEDNTVFYWEGYWDRRMADDEVLPHAKKCALIAVDELIKQVTHSDVGYWKEVKQEINKL